MFWNKYEQLMSKTHIVIICCSLWSKCVPIYTGFKWFNLLRSPLKQWKKHLNQNIATCARDTEQEILIMSFIQGRNKWLKSKSLAQHCMPVLTKYIKNNFLPLKWLMCRITESSSYRTWQYRKSGHSILNINSVSQNWKSNNITNRYYISSQ